MLGMLAMCRVSERVEGSLLGMLSDKDDRSETKILVLLLSPGPCDNCELCVKIRLLDLLVMEMLSTSRRS